MQIIELYIKGYKRIDGEASSTASNKLIDSTAEFTNTIDVGDLITNQETQQTATVTAIDSDTQLSISSDIFTSVAVYRITSDYFRADLFKDESIVITDSLLNVRDISKVFTPFSKQFNLPASKLNNKLFRHYENTDIENSFDARFRHDAIIKLNGIDYKKGKIQFNSVQLKNNKAHSYKVTFFGNTVDLKEILGDAKLSGLNYGDLDFDYTSSNIINLMTNDDATVTSTYGSTDILVPNIHHSKNMRFTNAGYLDNITSSALEWTDVKPALRVRAIVDAINRTYPQINIKGFFESAQAQDFYLWLHRNEGFVTNSDEGGGTQIIRNRFRHASDSPLDYTHTSTTPSSYGDVRTVYVEGPAWRNRIVVRCNVTSSTTESYTITFYKGSTEQQLYSATFDNGGSNFAEVYLTTQNYGTGAVDVTVEVTASSSITMTQTLVIKKEQAPIPSGLFSTIYTANYSPASSNLGNTFYISKQVPDMKVLDFLSGLFKMFNLVVFKDGDDINVQPASWYMNIGKSYDITKYVNMESSNLERLFQYKRMEFKFKSKKSFLVQFADEINGTPFAEEDYGNDEWDGGVYKLELPFEKMMYERLSNEDTGDLSDIGQGAMLDKKFEPTIGEPLILCMAYQDGDGDWAMSGTSNQSYRRPTQMTSFNWSYNGYLALNFGEENDEWLQTLPSDTVNLFDSGYYDYVESVFDPKARMLKVSAYLPLSIISQYKMNDKFVINNKSYRINSIKINLLTNKTDLELYNKDEFISQLQNGQVAYAGRIAQLSESTKGTDFITVTWDLLSDPNVASYDVFVNGGLFSSEANTVNTKKVNGLQSNTSYNISVRVKYNAGYYSFDTGLTAKTD